MILPEGLVKEVQLLLSQDKKVAAIELVHTLTKSGLKESFEIVGKISRGESISTVETEDIDR
ncbi:hypothetical protein [Pedobacter cryoconitis]|uniref:Ribosomal protein L7/L12 n=1 Tax=Pedobacter cryoconitis TaxID=188932 RepID=A0A7X0J452_9SPHI|nr:hypothetical protein [Pedobacter cryoconitis]MBB6500710.1 ribosomal protein L7/L12 [Pedobacter cryoconitis]